MFAPWSADGRSHAYVRPLPLARGFGRRRLEVFSPKLGRRASLGGYDAWKLWLALEANPQVQCYCERPAFLPGRRGRMADFWVQTHDLPSGEFWLLSHSNAEDSLGDDTDGSVPGRLHNLPLRLIDPEALSGWSIPVANWSQIVPHLASWHRFPDKLLAQSIVVFVDTWRTRDEILWQFRDRDATEVEAALYALVVEGRVVSPDLVASPLSGTTQFKRV